MSNFVKGLKSVLAIVCDPQACNLCNNASEFAGALFIIAFQRWYLQHKETAI